MKRLFAILLVLLLPLSALADWYCPTCGRLNDNNFCPVDGTAMPVYSSYTAYSTIVGVLNSKLATRTGPGTQYDEPGTFLSAGSQVLVLSKAFDQRNNIWWLQVEFSASGSLYRAYTGLKRFNNVNINAVPEERVIGRCTINQSINGYYGPGYNYRAISKKIPAGVSCTIYGYATAGDSDFIQVEFYDSSLQRYRRAWVYDWIVDDYEMYYGF